MERPLEFLMLAEAEEMFPELSKSLLFWDRWPEWSLCDGTIADRKLELVIWELTGCLPGLASFLSTSALDPRTCLPGLSLLPLFYSPWTTGLWWTHKASLCSALKWAMVSGLSFQVITDVSEIGTPYCWNVWPFILHPWIMGPLLYLIPWGYWLRLNSEYSCGI